MKTIFGYFLFFVLILSSYLSCNPNQHENTDKENGTTDLGITLPPGFRIDIYADNVKGARSMALSPNGVLFVGTRNAGNVYAILDTNRDYKADKVITIASGLNEPNGVALKDGSLYVAEINRVIRFDAIEKHLYNPPKPVVINDTFPSDRHHGWKFIRFGPDGKLYVPVGAPCNICMPDYKHASLFRMNPDGSDLEKYASGIRNTVGFDWNPETKVLWFTDNGRDMLGDDIPSDELNRAPEKGLNFGFPYMFGKDVRDPEFGKGVDLSKFVKPAMELGPHVASLGMRFYTGNMFPPEYKNQIFIAEHGSWNRSQKIGYRVVAVKVSDGKAISQQIFAQGWLKGQSVSGRPVDVQQMDDGSLLVSDDFAGVIYRITYHKP
jgi:glucose/arabinose dehydrogenase